jgi:hypothetical protein
MPKYNARKLEIPLQYCKELKWYCCSMRIASSHLSLLSCILGALLAKCLVHKLLAV